MQLPAKQLTWVTGSSGSNPDLSARSFTHFVTIIIFATVILCLAVFEASVEVHQEWVKMWRL